MEGNLKGTVEDVKELEQQRREEIAKTHQQETRLKEQEIRFLQEKFKVL